MDRTYPHITVTQGMSGWFAVMMHLNTEDIPGTPFPEPWSTGVGRYRMQAAAIAEGKQWAEAEGLPFYSPTIDTTPARQDVEQQIREIIPDVKVVRLKKRYK